VDGLLQWDGANISNAQVNEIGKRVNVQLGDTVVTSGSSAYLPRGVDVGFVTQIEPMGDVLNITIELKTDFTKVLDVMVISNVFRLEQLQLESNQNPEGV
jgi:rod shape-determining protein MreC